MSVEVVQRPVIVKFRLENRVDFTLFRSCITFGDADQLILKVLYIKLYLFLSYFILSPLKHLFSALEQFFSTISMRKRSNPC